MRIVRAASQLAILWKNGGGTTREIARMPVDSTLDSFDWRISRAHVATAGPFSRFSAVDRTLLVLSGDALSLDVAGQGIVTLGPESAPFSFDGDIDVMARLTGGPVDDLNVMSRRGRTRHEVARKAISKTGEMPVRGDAMVVFVESGKLIVEDDTFVAGDAIVYESGEVITVESRGTPNLVVIDVWNVRR